MQIFHNQIKFLCVKFLIFWNWCMSWYKQKNKQLIIAFFIDFESILYIAIEKFEFFDEIYFENIFVENIWFRNIAKEINETNKTNEQINIDFFLILHVNFDTKIRKFKFLKKFRTWNSRIYSWNLLLKLKFCLQRLQIRRIDIFFVEFDIILNMIIEKFDFLNETNCENISIFVTKFLNVAKKIDNFYDKNEHVIVDLFAVSYVNLILLMRFKISCSWIYSKKFWFKLKFCSQNLHIVWTHVIF